MRGAPTGANSAGDMIAVTVSNKAGGLWYASSWDGTTAPQQNLSGGQLSIR